MNWTQVVSRISYRPGWELTIMHHDRYGEKLIIEAMVQCAYDHSRTIPIKTVTMLPPLANENDMVYIIYHALLEAERHEAGEFFQYGSTRPFDPHSGGA